MSNKCEAMDTFTRCPYGGSYTVAPSDNSADRITTCGVHLGRAMLSILQALGNAVDHPVTITATYDDRPSTA